jgi:hypothetical protein
VYDPGVNELLEDYVGTRRKYRSRIVRFWLNTCFTLRTALLLVDCWRVLAASKAVKMLLNWTPEPVKRWWIN